MACKRNCKCNEFKRLTLTVDLLEPALRFHDYKDALEALRSTYGTGAFDVMCRDSGSRVQYVFPDIDANAVGFDVSVDSDRATVVVQKMIPVDSYIVADTKDDVTLRLYATSSGVPVDGVPHIVPSKREEADRLLAQAVECIRKVIAITESGSPA